MVYAVEHRRCLQAPNINGCNITTYDIYTDMMLCINKIAINYITTPQQALLQHLNMYFNKTKCLTTLASICRRAYCSYSIPPRAVVCKHQTATTVTVQLAVVL